MDATDTGHSGPSESRCQDEFISAAALGLISGKVERGGRKFSDTILF